MLYLLHYFKFTRSIYQNYVMAASEILRRLETRAVTAEQLIQSLKMEIAEMKRSASEQAGKAKMRELEAENENLRKEVEEWKQRLVQAEIQNGVIQVAVPNVLTSGIDEENSTLAPVKKDILPAPAQEKVESNITSGVSQESITTAPAKKESSPPATQAKVESSQEKSSKKEKKKEKAGPTDAKKPKGGEDELPVDVGRLDFRVGKILSAKKHPDADSLYVEDVDIGQERTFTVVSGLVKFVPIEEMQNRMAVLLCNLKPVKMRGVTSEAMVMCASTPDKVEILTPPEGSVPGDLVEFAGYERRPDPVLNPKKKVFETVAPDLKTDSKNIATYKGVPFTVPGKGFVVASSLVGVQIK